MKHPGKPPRLPGGEKKKTLLESILTQFKWLVFGVPKPKSKGTWVYNSKDDTWRFYVREYE